MILSNDQMQGRIEIKCYKCGKGTNIYAHGIPEGFSDPLNGELCPKCYYQQPEFEGGLELPEHQLEMEPCMLSEIKE